MTAFSTLIGSATRRRFVKLAVSALAFAGLASLIPSDAFAQDNQKKVKVLFLTKSQGFQHPVIARKAQDPAALAHAERVFTEFAGKDGYEVTVTKDADIFKNPDTYRLYDVFAFYTTEDLTKDSDKYTEKKGRDGKVIERTLLHTEKGMGAEGKAMFLKAIEDGKGFIGFHCATDTFHSANRREIEMLRPANAAAKPPADPYIAMVGGEFRGHGSQQKAVMRVATTAFPGLEDLKDFELHEEWYNLYNLAPDMHVILVQDTRTMKVDKTGQREPDYRRDPYPATWAKMHGKGRVFYTSMGHREDVWTNPIFQKVTIAGLNWVSGRTQFNPTPNMPQVAPQPGTPGQASAR